MKEHASFSLVLLLAGGLSAESAPGPKVEGQVRLSSGEPAVGAQVSLFDLADLRAAPLAAVTDGSGHFELSLEGSPSALSAVPDRFDLGANYPNPFNPSTVIPFQLPAPTHVRLEVFNVRGQRVTTLVDRVQPAGYHTARWDATDAAGRAVAAGVYLYRLRGGGVSLTQRMVLIDGQAGVPAAGSAPAPGVAAAAPGDGPVYGLTVSGPGLVPYVDPAFRVTTGPSHPVELAVRTLQVSPLAKAASTGSTRILGDVDNNGRVDFFDALLVALYSRDAFIAMPNNGDISLGDVNRDGWVDLSDAWVIAAYLNDPSDAGLPAGIGEPVTPPAVTPGKIYWTDFTADKIQRSDLDGSNVEDLVATGLVNPYGLALDKAGGKMYWTDYGTDKIQRANLNGSQVEDLVTTGLITPGGLALDIYGGKMYWTDLGTDKIQRANLDGSEVEDLITEILVSPNGLALDVEYNAMYWTDYGTDTIQRANIGGLDSDELVTGLTSPGGLALDLHPAGLKMYWTDYGTDKIQRANLDGSEVEDLVTTGLRSPRGLAVDEVEGKIYWADPGTDKIQRANLDGSQVEDLVATGLEGPVGIALDPDHHGDQPASATLVTLESATAGYLNPGDVDYFRVDLTRARILVAYTTGTTDTFGSIEDNTGTWLADDDDGGEGSNFRISRFVQAGTYYILVQGWDHSATGSYTLHVR